jgi:hypothetical protein
VDELDDVDEVDVLDVSTDVVGVELVGASNFPVPGACSDADDD